MKTNKKRKNYEEQQKIPFAAITQAKKGDWDAMRRIMAFYRPYIRTFSMIDLYDASGRKYRCLDEERQHELESKLLWAILKDFDPV